MATSTQMMTTEPVQLRPVMARAPLSLEEAVAAFLVELEAKNRSQATITAYRGDLAQFAAFLKRTNYTATTVQRIERADISEYLADLGRNGLSGVTRARKLAAIRELFRFLESSRVILPDSAK